MTYRLATVSFLNAVPLVDWFGAEGAGRVVLRGDLPSRLPALLDSGEADAALLPVVEIFRGRSGGMIGSAGIACDGPVSSVKLFHRGDWRELRRVGADRGSRTSVALLQVLLAESAAHAPSLHEVEPRPGTVPPAGEGMLVIGDRCFEFDRWLAADPTAGAQVRSLDLGAAWKESTGLPFVFAAWALAPGFAADRGAEAVRELSVLLSEACGHGISRLGALAEREAAHGRLGHNGEATREALFYYFAESLRFRLGERELAGCRRFHELCTAHGLAPAGPFPDMH